MKKRPYTAGAIDYKFEEIDDEDDNSIDNPNYNNKYYNYTVSHINRETTPQPAIYEVTLAQPLTVNTTQQVHIDKFMLASHLIPIVRDWDIFRQDLILTINSVAHQRTVTAIVPINTNYKPTSLFTFQQALDQINFTLNSVLVLAGFAPTINDPIIFIKIFNGKFYLFVQQAFLFNAGGALQNFLYFSPQLFRLFQSFPFYSSNTIPTLPYLLSPSAIGLDIVDFNGVDYYEFSSEKSCLSNWLEYSTLEIVTDLPIDPVVILPYTDKNVYTNTQNIMVTLNLHNTLFEDTSNILYLPQYPRNLSFKAYNSLDRVRFYPQIRSNIDNTTQTVYLLPNDKFELLIKIENNSNANDYNKYID